MARKIGDIAIGIVILVFLLTGITYVFLDFDKSIGQSTPLTSDVSDLSSQLGDSNDMTAGFSQQVDNATSLTADPNTETETRTASSAGVLNLFSKNILIRFSSGVAEKYSLPSPILIFLVGLITVTVTILVTRFFAGEGRA